MEVYVIKTQKKESVANTLTGANNDIELFFSYQGRENFGLFLYKKCVGVFTLCKKKL